MPSPFCSGHISIHAPRMGSDPAMVRRSPDGERPGDGSPLPGRSIFQSTLPGWGATDGCAVFDHLRDYFNPRSPDGERRFGIHFVFPSICISIHAPRMGSDALIGTMIIMMWYFNPRSPDGERPRSSVSTEYIVLFQSTLPGWGATRRCARWCAHVPNFNPRSPNGERPRKWTSSPTIWAKSSIFNTDCIADRR